MVHLLYIIYRLYIVHLLYLERGMGIFSIEKYKFRIYQIAYMAAVLTPWMRSVLLYCNPIRGETFLINRNLSRHVLSRP